MALMIILAAIVILVIGYICYGGWLARQWGIDSKNKTPAVTMADGVDYVATPPAVLMGHHFSSIAGAGPINGPVQASVFGWVPVFLWCVLGGIFVGGLQDFGSLVASIRNDGKSVGEIIKASMGRRARTLFTIFALLVMILAIASFVNVVAGTFFTPAEAGQSGFVMNPDNNQTTAMVSMLFIILAVIYGMLTNRGGMKTAPATVIGIIGIVASLVIGLHFGIALSRNTWIVIIGIYITIASLVPVWIMLQPRDYLSSYLLYSMMAIALAGIVFSTFSKSASFRLPAFTGWTTGIGPLFPTLFITVACGACSGFHSLIATGTSSKQLMNERHAQPISYGSMLIESALGIISLISVGMISTGYSADLGSPASAFANGIAAMFYGSPVIAALLTLAVSVFALTSLDSAARLSRFMFSELFLKEDETSWKDAGGLRRILTHPLFGTLFMVIVSCVLGGLSLSQIWGLFGSANQLLAGIALMAVCAWLGEVGKNNRMFFIPTIFMLAATLTQLVLTVRSRLRVISSYDPASGPLWGHYFQLIFAAAMIVLAVILAIEGFGTFVKQGSKKK